MLKIIYVYEGDTFKIECLLELFKMAAYGNVLGGLLC